MTRSKCGLLLLLAAGVAACGGDPTDSFREKGEKVVADPSVVFVNQGASVFVVAQLQDDQGNQLNSDFSAGNAGAQISVATDSTFLQTTNGTSLKTRERFVVTGLQPGASSFEITAGNVTQTVPVNVVPTSLGASFSNASPAVNEPLTITLAAGYKFSADAGVESDLGPGFVQSFSPDSTAITVLIPPGSTGPLTLSGVSAAFLPGLPLSLPTIDPVSASSTGLAGTDDPNTAPTIATPALDQTTVFFDAGTFTAADITGDGGVGAQYYKFVVTEAGDYHFVTDWAGTSDIDPVVCFDAACSDGAFAGSGVDHPEDGVVTLDPGTYYFVAVLFAGSPPPYWVLSLTHNATPAE